VTPADLIDSAASWLWSLNRPGLAQHCLMSAAAELDNAAWHLTGNLAMRAHALATECRETRPHAADHLYPKVQRRERDVEETQQ
jgi:hypothetical protein